MLEWLYYKLRGWKMWKEDVFVAFIMLVTLCGFFGIDILTGLGTVLAGLVLVALVNLPALGFGLFVFLLAKIGGR